MPEIRIKNTGHHPLPTFQTEGSAGMDLQALLEAPVTLQPLERRVIPTGLYVAIEPGYEIQVRARSGLSLKHGITLANGIGTIDSDYRGEIGVILVNLSDTPYTLHDGDRIAQMVMAKVEKPKLIPVDSLSDTARSDGGFGHSGY